MKLFFIPSLMAIVCLFIYVNNNYADKHNRLNLTEEHSQVLALKTGSRIMSMHPLKPFALVDDRGQPFTEKNLSNQWSLIFFGYTKCPEFCPTVFNSIDRIGQHLNHPHLKYYVVTVDPSRDDPKTMNEFFSQYRTKICGLTGDIEQIQQMAADLKMTVEKAQGYEQHITHSAALILVNPQGKIRGILRDYQLAKDVAKDIKYIQSLEN